MTTRKMTSFGYIKFKDIETKKRFKKGLGGVEDPIKYDEEHKLNIGDNEDKQQQARGRAIGKVKRALHELREGRTDVVADRRAGEVWIGQECVAKWIGVGLRLKGEALKAKARIDALIAEKRRPQDTLSEGYD